MIMHRHVSHRDYTHIATHTHRIQEKDSGGRWFTVGPLGFLALAIFFCIGTG